MTSNCTTCEIQADKSAYWTPQLYFSFTNGSFTPVANGGTVVYYLGRGDNASSIVPFPPDFRMLSGDASARSYDNSTLTYLNSRPVADRTSFACIDYNHPSPETPSMTNTNCPDGLRAQIQFQSCWDGVNAYLPNSAHVAYMSQIDNGVCPPTHPVPLPHLFFEVYYSVAQFSGVDGKFVFANGDETEYSFHGDFMSGWDADLLKAGVDGCLTGNDNASGVTKDCAAFASTIDENFATDCPAAPPVFDEPVTGMLSSLPGCNPLSDGPGGPVSVWCKVGGNGTVAAAAAAAAAAMGVNASTSAIPAAATAAVADLLTTNDGSALTMTSDDSVAAAAALLTADASDADADTSLPTVAASAAASSTDDDSNDSTAASSTANIFSQLASALPAAPTAAAAAAATTTTPTDAPTAAPTDAPSPANEATAAAPSSPTSIIDPSAACSMYSHLSVVGCASAVLPQTTEYAATTTVMADGSAESAESASWSVITTLVTLTISV